MSRYLLSMILLLSFILVNAQVPKGEIIQIEPYFPLKKELKYHVSVICDQEPKRTKCKKLEYDLYIEYLYKIGKIYQYKIAFRNIKGSKESKDILNNISKFSFEITTDAQGNYLQLTNWDYIETTFIQYTNFKDKNAIEKTLKHLVAQLFFLYGKEVSDTAPITYLSPIIVNEDFYLDGESNIQIVENENDVILIKSIDQVTFESDLTKIKVTDAEIEKNYLYDTSKKLLLLIRVESVFKNMNNAVKFVRTMELIEEK